jgi:cytochrome c556
MRSAQSFPTSVELMHALKVGPLVVFLCLASAAAHEHATGVVKDRMDAMEEMAKHMKAIGERVKSKRDLATIKSEAHALQALAAHVTHLFPPGSTQPPTDAKLAIWQNWPDFETKADALKAASVELENADPSDFRALSSKVRAISQTCGGCHELYRERK